jgi:hypothetical protein
MSAITTREVAKSAALVAAIVLGVSGVIGMRVLIGAARYGRLPRSLREGAHWVLSFAEPVKFRRYQLYAVLWFILLGALAVVVSNAILSLGD